MVIFAEGAIKKQFKKQIMRSVWKGHIRFSLVTIPVQIFNAIETKGNVSFNQIHSKDNGPIGYKKYCKTCDAVVDSAEIVKGYEYEPDQFAIFSDEELDNIKLKSTKAIDIEAFVDIDEVHPTRFETVYYLGPEGEVAKKTFALLCETLRQTGKAGVGRIILREREDVMLIMPHQNALIMYKLRFPHEIRQIEAVPDTNKFDKADEAQLALAKQLVDSLSKPFEKVDFEDRYRDAILEMVEKKVKGKQIVNMEQGDEDKPVVDIMDALKKSIEEAKRKTA
jgi:DNA end-binding protein Ku